MKPEKEVSTHKEQRLQESSEHNSPASSPDADAEVPHRPESESDRDESETKGGEPAGADPERYFGELAEKAERLVEQTDWAYVSMELANIELQWEEGPDPGDSEIAPFRNRIDAAREKHEEIKKAHYEEQNRIKEENLEKKKGLLTQLESIVEEEKWSATREVSRIRGKWDQVKPLPSGKTDQLQSRYSKLLREFESHKVDRIVRKKEKEEENLIGKLVILDKIDALLSEVEQEGADWSEAEKGLEDLSKQWHRIGRVPAEKNQELWHRYHQSQEKFHALRLRNDKSYRQQVESYLGKKRKLIKEAEALVDDEDLAAASRRVNKLHRRWKKVGNLPQKEENELWELFKSATDTFNERKSENLDELREQEQLNLERKQELIRKAEEMKESEEWDRTHEAYQQLMKEWKASGPVPKRISGRVWKQFKTAMDFFYDRRRDHFKEIKKERKDNLEEKREVLEELQALTAHENPVEAVELAKPLQEKFKKAGYVPIKFKNLLWKQYRDVCDQIYDRYRAVKSAAQVVGSESVSGYSSEDIATIQKKQKEAGRLRKELKRVNDELIQMKESLSYFKPSGKGKTSSLLDQVHEKLEKTEQEAREKEDRLDELEREIDRLKQEP